MPRYDPYERILRELTGGEKVVVVDRAGAKEVRGVVSNDSDHIGDDPGLADEGVFIDSSNTGGRTLRRTFIAFRDIRGVTTEEHDLRD